MSETRGVEMSPAEVDAFLAGGGTGVLSLARGDEPYATPVSYGYDRNLRSFFLRLGVEAATGKREFLESGGGARLVTYGPVEGGWTSVVAAGNLDPVDDEDLTVEVAEALRESELPLLAIWGDELEGVRFEIYRLAVEELTGRTTVER